MPCMRIRLRAVTAAGALGAVALSMAACGPRSPSPAGPSPTDGMSATRERDALVALYAAAGGSDWTNTTNWLGSEPLGTWYGVETENGRVTKLDLCGPGGNNLRGTIPPELGDLTHARELRLSNNFLTGAIPAALGNMTALGILRLSGNALSGPVPAELGDLTNLWELRLHRNQLTGELPRTLMTCPASIGCGSRTTPGCARRRTAPSGSGWGAWTSSRATAARRPRPAPGPATGRSCSPTPRKGRWDSPRSGEPPTRPPAGCMGSRQG